VDAGQGIDIDQQLSVPLHAVHDAVELGIDADGD
jgi:hypothetical protein